MIGVKMAIVDWHITTARPHDVRRYFLSWTSRPMTILFHADSCTLNGLNQWLNEWWALNDFSASCTISASHSDSVAINRQRKTILLSSIFVKLFENIIMYKYADKLHTSELQFGFKNNSSTHVCTMVLKETLSYYTTHNSHVFCTFLDASKAFDRVNYCKLFNILVDRGLPPYIMRVIIKLYTSQQARVSWSGCLSGYFAILNGVRQGGVQVHCYIVYIFTSCWWDWLSLAVDVS